MDVNSQTPFEAYSGTDPYIFVSYAHSDGSAVFPEIAYLHEQGYRIWYDEGADCANEWTDQVAKALAKSALCLVFVSPYAAKSQYVRSEINYARDCRTPLLAIHIAETQLPSSLE